MLLPDFQLGNGPINERFIEKGIFTNFNSWGERFSHTQNY